MRFSVQKKIITLGLGLSSFLIVAAFLVSFFSFQSMIKETYIKSIDNSISELEHTIGDNNKLLEISNLIVDYYDVMVEQVDKETPEFKSVNEKYDYYSNLYSIYPSNSPIIGLSRDTLNNRTTYIEISSYLANSAISAGSKSAYAGIIFDDYSPNKFVYMFDSQFRFNSEELKGNFFGTVYDFTPQDKDINVNSGKGEFIINGKNSRVIDFRLGTYEELIRRRYDGNQGKIDDKLNELNDKQRSQEIILTAFIEYDLSTVKDEMFLFSMVEGLSLIVVLALFIFTYILIARVTLIKNISKLTNASKQFTSNLINNASITSIDPDIHVTDEIGDLSKSFIQMEDEIINYTKKIEAATRDKEKINAELSIATKIQLESLPNKSFNDRNVVIEASIKSAKEVGGDFYDYFYIDKNHLAIIISDVSGKGVPAALFMMKAKQLINSKLAKNISLEQVCYEVNNELLANNDEGLFITAFIGILDVKNSRLEYINCGHERPYIIKNNSVTRLEVKSNFILGGLDNYKYEKEFIDFNYGDRLFIHTDGLNEAINEHGDEFGYDRIISCLRNNSKLRMNELLNEMKKDLNSFVNNLEAFDDVTMLLLEFKSPNLDFIYKNPNYSIIEEVSNKFNDYYSFINKDILSKVNIIIDEVLNNFISYEKIPNLIIEIKFKIEFNKLHISFINNGLEFNPLNKKINYIDKYSDDLPEGGLGLTIIKSISDKLDYERKDNKNIIMVEKNII